MTGAALSPPSVFSPAPVARFGAALGASAVAHWMLLAAPLSHLPWQGMAPIAESAPMTVRLAPAPVPDAPAAAEPDARRAPQPAKPSSGQPESWPGGDSVAESRPPALPQAPDPIYYPARDLDDYPRPLAPLRFDRPAHAGAGEVRLELLIDERGVVRDVVFAGPARSRGAEEELRATLAATPFLPARRDGRAVKSRVLMSINFEIRNR